ncbi:MAG: hypothetical protein AAF226_18125, partial [Verrucomicrobiota bacterium]
WLTEKIQISTRSQVELGSFKRDGSDMFIESFLSKGYEDAAYAETKVDAIRAELGWIKNKAFQIPEVTISQAKVVFSDDRLKRLSDEPAPSTDEVVVVEKKGAPSFIRRFLPEKVEVGEIRVGSAVIESFSSDGELEFAVRGTQASVDPDFENKSYVVNASGGKLIVAGVPEVKIQSVDLTAKGKSIFINDGDFKVYGDGHVDADGEIILEEKTELDLNVEFSDIDLTEVIGGEWKERIEGKARGNAKVTGTTDSLMQKGHLVVDDALLQTVPFLEKVADFTDTERFNRLTLNQCEADFERTSELVKLTNIQLQSDGLLRIEGNIDIAADRAIDGMFQLGISSRLADKLPFVKDLVFKTQRDGFNWTPMKIGGTLDDPQNSLVDLMKNLWENAQILEQGKGLLEGLLKGVTGGNQGGE